MEGMFPWEKMPMRAMSPCWTHPFMLSGGDGGSRAWGLSADIRVQLRAMQKGYAAKINLSALQCLLEWHLEPCTLESYL